MALRSTTRKVRRSFTLTPSAVAFIGETRQKRAVASDSEALDLLLVEAMLEGRRQEIDTAYKHYYDTRSDEGLAEQREWAEMAGPNMFIGVPEP